MADIDVTSSSSNSVDVVGLDNIKADLTLELPQPFKIDATNSYDIKPLKSDYTYDIKPLQTDNSLKIDLRPLTLDLCTTMNIGKLPDLCVRQPYRHRLAFSLYGMEVWGFTFSGEQETVVQEMDRRPQVALGGAPASWPPPRPPEPAAEPLTRTGNGLRIRLGS